MNSKPGLTTGITLAARFQADRSALVILVARVFAQRVIASSQPLPEPDMAWAGWTPQSRETQVFRSQLERQGFIHTPEGLWRKPTPAKES